MTPEDGTVTPQLSRLLPLGLLLVAIAWGVRVTVLEGFVYAWPRGFSGDFWAAMYSPGWWDDGKGIIYGPVFVVERWLVNLLPGIFTIYTFALANVLLAAGAFIFCIRACGTGLIASLLGLASWVCYWRLFYSFSVAANLEFLELLFLSAAWFAACRRRERTEGVLVAAAGLTKLIPWVFVIALFLRRAWRAFVPLALFTTALILVVGIGQHMSAIDTLTQTIIPFGGRPTSFHPVAFSEEYMGLPEVWTWSLYGDVGTSLNDKQGQLLWFLFVATAMVALGLTVLVSTRLCRLAFPKRDLTLMYAMFFALVPVLSPAVHKHTFVFLLPVWIGLVDLLWTRWSSGANRVTTAVWATLAAACYAMTGFPQALKIADMVLGTPLADAYRSYLPMVGNLMLLLVLWIYTVVATRAEREARLEPDALHYPAQ